MFKILPAMLDESNGDTYDASKALYGAECRGEGALAALNTVLAEALAREAEVLRVFQRAGQHMEAGNHTDHNNGKVPQRSSIRRDRRRKKTENGA